MVIPYSAIIFWLLNFVTFNFLNTYTVHVQNNDGLLNIAAIIISLLSIIIIIILFYEVLYSW